MFSQELTILLITAASIGFFHTLFGPDHYLPFIVMSKARRWSVVKTVSITVACGIGHIGSSIVLGLVGVMFGIALNKLEFIESYRGDLAAWAFIAFGLAYFIWGIKRAIRNKPHSHLHIHPNGLEHEHTHSHSDDHIHVHNEPSKKSLTPWVLFIIFIFGPCEPLIPILMYPAATESTFGMIIVAGVFGITTLATMLTAVLLGAYGLNFLPLGKLERYSHSLAGFIIFMSGAAIKFLGL